MSKMNYLNHMYSELLCLVNKWRFKLEKNKWKKIFKNYHLLEDALIEKKTGSIKLLTHDGLKVNIRQNIFDARIVREVFLNKQYSLNVSLPMNSTIVDIGGYIGDFSIYAAKYLKAKKVFVYEPTFENFEFLKLNIEDNKFSDIITPINNAVGKHEQLKIYIQKLDNDEIHASSHLHKEYAEERLIDSITLEEVIKNNKIDAIDLLKIDCEGNEYEILLSSDIELFNKISNIIFEYHKTDNYKEKLSKVLEKLESLNYKIFKKGSLVYAKKHS